MHRFAVAPMLEITDRYFRLFCRVLSRHTTLWTEMVHADAILHSSSPDELVGFNPREEPLVLQLGGSDPDRLGEAALIAKRLGYKALNLNCGCPSPRVTAGCFGACLMREPELVARCLTRMAESSLECSVKCRIGVDEDDSYEFVYNFVRTISDNSPCRLFVIHARKAYLKGLSPKDNRTIPPLKYETVYRLVADFPSLTFVLNGGITDLSAAAYQIQNSDIFGVMLGRAISANIWLLSNVDRIIFGDESSNLSRREALLEFAKYADIARGKSKNKAIFVWLKPLVSLFAGERGAAVYRQFLSNHSEVNELGSVGAVIEKAIALIEIANPEALDFKRV